MTITVLPGGLLGWLFVFSVGDAVRPCLPESETILSWNLDNLITGKL